MKKVTSLLCLMALFVFVFAGTPKKVNVNKAVGINENTNVVSNPINVTLKKNSTETVTAISTSVENLRSILGVGRNIWTDENGIIHVAFSNGTTGTYKLFYAQSSDNGATFDLDGPLGETLPGDDRYIGIFKNSDGVYIGYNENGVPITGARAPMVLYCDEPFTNPWQGNDAARWTLDTANYLLSNMAGNMGGATNLAIGSFWDATGGVKNPIVLSTSATTFQHGPYVGGVATDHESAAGIVSNGSYVLAAYGVYIDDTVLDTLIWNYSAGNSGGTWMHFAESNDGGATFGAETILFGYNYTDYPAQQIDTGAGPAVDVRLAGPTGWNNLMNPVIVNGKVYVLSNVETVDPNGGEWSGISGIVVSQKPAAVGGTWTHSVVSTPFDVATGEGNYWYAGIGSIHGHPELMYVMAVDRNPDPDNIVFFGSYNGGLTWPLKKVVTGTDLGFADPAAATIFACVSPYGVYQDADNIFADVTFLLDNTGVVNTTQYHVRINIKDILSVGENNEPVVKGFDLAQNYPNPFNPSTTIKYTLGKNANVSLKIFNALGQEVRTLVNGSAQVANTPYEVRWDGKDNAGSAVASGVYMYRLEAGNVKMTKKMMFLK